jgi:hypothetical protein
MIKLKNLLNESPAAPQKAPQEQPGKAPQPDVMPGRPSTRPEPRRRSIPNPATSPKPAPKAQTKGTEKPHQAPKDGPKPKPAGMKEASNSIMNKIVARYKAEFDKLNEAEYDKIFDPETLGKLKGGVAQRIQDKNPMQIGMQMAQLAMQVMQMEKGNEDLLEQLALDVVNEAYPYLTQTDAITIDAKIVPQQQVKEALDTPEMDEEEEDEAEELTGELMKRRLVNAVTQGGASLSKTAHYVQQEYVDIVSGEGASDKYRDLMQAALDMIDFMLGAGMSGGGAPMEDNSVGAESVYFDFETEKWIIKARAICFPVLIHEIVKGMYEIIGLFGFNDLERGEKVVGKVDKIQNEPEDIAYGQIIAKSLQDVINKLETNVTPAERDDFLQDIYKLENNEFIQLITNIINDRITPQQMNQLKGMFRQMRSDLTADDADNALLERIQRMAGIR